MKKAVILSATFALAGFACTPTPPASSPLNVTEKTQNASWQAAGDGVFRYECVQPACPARMVIYRFPKNGFVWRFAVSETPRTVAAFLNESSEAVFAVNGVYWDENYRPTGALIAGGERVGEKTYELDRTAVLELAPEFRVIDTAKEKIDLAKLSEAGQSYPLLVRNGKAQDVAAEKKARRTFAGTDTDGNAYFGVVPDNELTLAETAALLTGIGVGWQNVINLDGGPSSGLAAELPNSNEIINSIVQIPNAIVGYKK